MNAFAGWRGVPTALAKAPTWPRTPLQTWLGVPRLRCSFCGRLADNVARLVAGNSAHICDSCVAECVAVLEQHGGFDRPGPTRPY